MICLQIPARLWEQALTVLADAVFQLLFAGGLTEIGRRAAHVMDISFKLRIFRHFLCFFDQRLMTSGLDDPPLMKGQGAKITSPKTSPVADQRKLYFRDRRHASVFFIRRMIRFFIGICIDLIHFFLAKRSGRRVLHYIQMSAVRLCQAFPRKRIGITVLHVKTPGIGQPVRTQFLIIRKHFRLIYTVQRTCFKYGSRNKRKILHRDPRFQRIGDLQYGAFAHSVGNKIRAGVQQNGSLQLIRPVIIVCHSSKTGFDPAQDNRRILVCLPDQVAVHDGGMIRTSSHHSAWRIGIRFSSFFRNRIMIHHGIHVAGRHQKPQPWLSIFRNRSAVLPVRLGDDADLISMSLQMPGNDGVSKGRMVHIGISGHVDKIHPVPSSIDHILPAQRQKPLFHSSTSYVSLEIS